MKLYTGYFAQQKKYQMLDNICVSIAGKPPFFYRGLEYKVLAPKYNFFIKYKNKEIDEDEYIRQYYEQVLNKLNPKQVIKDLERLTKNENNVVLLCYEKPNDFCHRHIVAEWLNENLKSELTHLVCEYPL